MSDADWFTVLEKRLDEISGSIKYRHRAPGGEEVIRDLASIFFGVWIRFAVDVGVELELQPPAWNFASYKGSKKFEFKEDFDLSSFTKVEITEHRFNHAVSLRAELVREGAGEGVRFLMQVGSESPIELYHRRLHRFEPKQAVVAIQPALLAWFEGHQRGDQRVMLDFLEGLR